MLLRSFQSTPIGLEPAVDTYDQDSVNLVWFFSFTFSDRLGHFKVRFQGAFCFATIAWAMLVSIV